MVIYLCVDSVLFCCPAQDVCSYVFIPEDLLTVT